MSDYSETGAAPVEDAATDDPPTEQEVREAQEREYPEQAETSTFAREDDGAPDA
jgi:hypothetical protein